MIDLRRLEVFVCVAQSGSLAAAAERMSFTPSAVSQQMSRLEVEIGAQLLVRGRRGVVLTEAGQLLAERGESILGQLDRVQDEVADLACGRAGRLGVGSAPTCAGPLAAPAIATFRAKHPRVQIGLVTHDVDELLRGLSRRLLDVALVALDEPRPGGPAVDHDILGEDRYVLALPRQHRLAAQESVDPADLHGERIIGTSDWPGLASLTRALAADGVTLRFDGLNSNDFHLAQSFVALGEGIALIPSLAAAPSVGRLEFRPLTRLAPARTIMALRLRDAPPRPAADTFIDAVRAALRARRSTQRAHRGNDNAALNPPRR
jgi:DNA-binding transcriptional LysR family regulator